MRLITLAVVMSVIFMACRKEENKTIDLGALAAEISASNSFHNFNTATTRLFLLTEVGDTAISRFANDQAIAIKEIQQQYHLNKEDLMSVFERIKFAPDEITVTSETVSEVNMAGNPCKAQAYAVFALSSTACIASVAVPFIGEGLVILCTNATIAVLATSLKACQTAK